MNKYILVKFKKKKENKITILEITKKIIKKGNEFKQKKN